MLEQFAAGLSPLALLAAIGVTFLAGLVKGALGFALPMIMISGLSGFMPVQLALVGLMLPMLLTNISQMLRQGAAAAWGSTLQYWRLLISMVVFLFIGAQFLTFLPPAMPLAILGGPLVAFALLQLMQVQIRLSLRHRERTEWITGIVAGLYGGVSGVWGPPVMVYLISDNTQKHDMVRILGVVFMIGTLAFIAGHLASGIVTAPSMRFSALLAVPAMLGLWAGYLVQDRLDAARFRRWTLILLVLTGLNLMRQSVGL